jgi:hypothetical protein
MIIQVEGFDQYNNFINKNITINNQKIKDLGKWAKFFWYKDGIQLDNNYNDWKENDTYEVMFNNDYININLKINNKNIITPLISKKITIKELKNILSIKDNIYFKQNKLKDENTLEDYDINNMDNIDMLIAISYNFSQI